MAKLLGMPEFDMKNPQAGGFGCSECHTTKGHLTPLAVRRGGRESA